VGVGFIGTGIQGRGLLNGCLGREDMRVVAVCDVDTTRREDAKARVDKKYGNSDCGAYTDYHELLARKDVEAVVIATPDHWHAIQVVAACAAGKDIYCEKPLCLTLHEGRVMIDAVRKHGRVFQTGSQQRTEYDGRFRRACEYVRSGRLGRVYTVHVGIGTSSVWCDLPEEAMEPGLDWERWQGPARARGYNAILSPRGVHNHYPDWRKYREYSGGLMTDWGAHHFDIAQWALGMDASGPVEVHPPRDGKDMMGARFVYGNGVEMYHGGPFGVTFVGEKGVIYVTRDRLESIPGKIIEEPLKEGEVHLPEAKGHVDNWVECIASRERPICDVEVGARSIACSHLANTVYWNRVKVGWDPAAWTFTDPSQRGWMDYERRAGYELPGA
jgi:predicted dehydrogenase